MGRKAKLRQWNFDCSCEVCDLPQVQLAENDTSRRAIALHHQLIPRYMASWKVDRALGAASAKVEEQLLFTTNLFLVIWLLGRLTGHWVRQALKSKSNCSSPPTYSSLYGFLEG